MARRSSAHEPAMVSPDELAAAVSEDTAALELEKLQKKIAREERKKRREIEAASQKRATWLLPTLLLITMIVSWVLSQIRFSDQSTSETTGAVETVDNENNVE